MLPRRTIRRKKSHRLRRGKKTTSKTANKLNDAISINAVNKKRLTK